MPSSRGRRYDTPVRRNPVHTFDALAGAYVQDLQARNASPATIQTYEQSFATFRAFLQATGQSQQLSALTSESVRAYQIWLRETPLPRVYKGTTVRSMGGVHTKIRQLRALVRFGEAEGVITQRVKVTEPKLPERPFDVFSEADLRTIFSSRYLTGASEGAIRNRALFGLLLDTGLRVAEAAHLELCDLYLEDRLVRVTGKGDKTRFVPFSLLVADRLAEWLDVRGPQPGPVFELKVGGFHALVRALSEATGINCHCHRWRHTFATLALKQGMDPFTLKRILGHRRIETTLIYVNLSTEDLRDKHDQFSPLTAFEARQQPRRTMKRRTLQRERLRLVETGT
jgi:integrase/recombinase XerD